MKEAVKETRKAISAEAHQQYSDMLEAHMAAFTRAAVMLDLGLKQLIAHDKSKYETEEWEPYIRHFILKENEACEFQYALLHHYRNNPHHPEHWIIPGKWNLEFQRYDNILLEMPKEYAKEMVADWMASNWCYQKTWNMSEWLNREWARIPLHDKTRECVKTILECLGYSCAYNIFAWKREMVPPELAESIGRAGSKQ